MTGRHKRRLAAGTMSLMAMGILQVLARKLDGFGEWYAVHIYPLLVNTVSRLLSPLPFSVVEILLYLLIAGLLVGVFCLSVKVFSGKNTVWQGLSSALAAVYCLTGVLLLVYTATCGINYYRQPFSKVGGFVIAASTNEELIALCEELVDRLNETAGLVTVGPEGSMVLPDDARQLSRAAMLRLSKEYVSLSGYYPLPKPLMVSKVLAVQQLCGIYSPFTVEANYNKEMPDYNIPFTACHELSHLKGFMREDEANFIAFLACRGSDSPEFQYSAYLTAYVYATNALYRSVGAEAYEAVRASLCVQAQKDLAANNVYWDRYDTKVAEVANNLNNTYLRANSQSDGVKSYGRLVDLLLADYRNRNQ